MHLSKHTKTCRPIEGRNGPLPSPWPNFIVLSKKTDLARFLYEELLTKALHDTKILVTEGLQIVVKLLPHQSRYPATIAILYLTKGNIPSPISHKRSK